MMFVQFTQWSNDHRTPMFTINVSVELFSDDLNKADYIRIASARIARVVDTASRAKKLGTKTQFKMTAPMTAKVYANEELIVDTQHARDLFHSYGFENGFFTFKGITCHKAAAQFHEAFEVLAAC